MSLARTQVATKHRETLNKLQVADVPRGVLSNQDTQCHLALSGGDRAGGPSSAEQGAKFTEDRGPYLPRRREAPKS